MIDHINMYKPRDLEEDGEISLSEVISFLRNCWQLIAITGFLGLLAGVAYIVLTPNSYEAYSQVRMAQIGTSSASSPFGVAIEEPAALISRMQIPSNITQEVSRACEVDGKSDPTSTFYKLVKLLPVKGVSGVVELKVLAPTPELAKNCLIAIFEGIKNSQTDLTAILIEEAKVKLAADEVRIESSRKLISSSHQLGAAMPAAYLSARDELNFYLADRERMVDLINSVKNRGTALTSPIYASDVPVSPHKIAGILLGLFGGILLGLLLAFGRLFWQKVRLMNALGISNQ